VMNRENHIGRTVREEDGQSGRASRDP
jgi:hypothetical protein